MMDEQGQSEATPAQVNIDGSVDRNIGREIREFCEKTGGAKTISGWNDALIDAGFFDDVVDRDVAWRRDCFAQVKSAFREEDANGIATMLPVTPGRTPLYKRQEELNFEEFEFVCRQRSKGIADDQRKLDLYVSECVRRFGREPELGD